VVGIQEAEQRAARQDLVRVDDLAVVAPVDLASSLYDFSMTRETRSGVGNVTSE
jgi:hypothetical protein